MMKPHIKVIAVGKMNAMEKQEIHHLISRISKKATFELIEIPDLPDDNRERAIREESKQILQKIDARDRVVLFDLEGKPNIGNVKLNPNVTTTFVIGGSNGVDEHVKKRANTQICISPFTFPHRLFRLLLLEHIEGLLYR